MYKHILIPVAPGHAGEYEHSLSVAKKLLSEDGKITVLSVIELLPNYVDAYLPTDHTAENISRSRTELREHFADERLKKVVIAGHPVSTILEWSDEHAADAIVISSHRPGLADLFLGSTASRVVRHAKCPVIVLR